MHKTLIVRSLSSSPLVLHVLVGQCRLATWKTVSSSILSLRLSAFTMAHNFVPLNAIWTTSSALVGGRGSRIREENSSIAFFLKLFRSAPL